MIAYEPLKIAGAMLLRPTRHGDNRGYFSEVFCASEFAAAGIPTVFPQDNVSFSKEAGVMRGLHFQTPPFAQGKLVRVVRGAIFDVIVDLRKGATYGEHVAIELDAADGAILWAPSGFAHGFLTLASDTEVTYKTTVEYAPRNEGGIAWDDPDLRINWPRPPAVISERDARWPPFSAFNSPF